jgi:hypothetical protein
VHLLGHTKEEETLGKKTEQERLIGQTADETINNNATLCCGIRTIKGETEIMLLNIEEKKVLYAFGCSSIKNTVTRLKYLTAIAVDPEVKHMFMVLSGKVEEGADNDGYFNYYYLLRREMDVYFNAKHKIDEIENNIL